jgi:hypothetical protein
MGLNISVRFNLRECRVFPAFLLSTTPSGLGRQVHGLHFRRPDEFHLAINHLGEIDKVSAILFVKFEIS